MEARGTVSIVALALLAAVGANRPPPAAHSVSVLVVRPFDPASYASRGAVGLMVPGAGPTVSRRTALASLVRGKVESSVLGGTPGGPPLIRLGRRPAEVTIYVALPPPGRHPNTTRYPVAIVGGGYHGLLTSTSTRLPGLVSIADIAPTARDFARGERPPIRARSDPDAPAELERIDERMARSQDVRLGATFVLVAAVLAGAVLAVATRSAWLARAGLLAAPTTLAASLCLSALDVTTPWLVVLLLALLVAAASLALGAFERGLLPALVAVIVVYLVVPPISPETNAFSALGPHPDRGARFYGSTNLTSGTLITVALVAGELAGPRLAWAVAALTLVTIGWSHAGADGGGLVMAAAGFAVLGLRLRRTRTTARVVALAAAAIVAAAFLLIGLDAATGGSSHVTHAVGKGPGSLLGDLGHRLHLSYATATSSWHTALVFAVSVAALAWLGTRKPRFPVGDALFVAIAVSLLVNDTPTDVASAGALSYAVVWAWERLAPDDRRASRSRRPTVAGDVPRVSTRA